jgi:hypothetical protein
MPYRAEPLTAALAHQPTWTIAQLDDGRVLVTTSQQYSDGDYVELIVHRTNGSVELSDGGEALARLDLAGVAVDRGRAREMWRRLLKAHGLEEHGEQLSLQGSLDALPVLIESMASAIANIDGIRLLAPPPRSPLFADRLLTFFQSEFEQVEEGPQLNGQSGVQYRATAAVGGESRSVIVQAVAGSSSQARRGSVEHAFTMFSDINGSLRPSQKLVVLSDADWRTEQTTLLASVAYVGHWLYRDSLVEFVSSLPTSSSHLLVPQEELRFP